MLLVEEVDLQVALLLVCVFDALGQLKILLLEKLVLSGELFDAGQQFLPVGDVIDVSLHL